MLYFPKENRALCNDSRFFLDYLFICSLFIKNISSSTSHKKTLKLANWQTLKLQNFSFFLSSTFIYELILIKKIMNANIMKTHIFYKMKYDLQGH